MRNAPTQALGACLSLSGPGTHTPVLTQGGVTRPSPVANNGPEGQEDTMDTPTLDPEGRTGETLPRPDTMLAQEAPPEKGRKRGTIVVLKRIDDGDGEAWSDAVEAPPFRTVTEARRWVDRQTDPTGWRVLTEWARCEVSLERAWTGDEEGGE